MKKYKIESVVKEEYGENAEYVILLKADEKSPQQISINVNKFKKSITLLENRTLVSEESEENVILNKGIPTPKEIILSPVEKQNVKLLSQLGVIKNT